MRVHIAEFVEGRGRRVQGDGQQHADEEEDFNQVAHVLENITRIYGYALLILVFCILFVLSICFPEYTVWPVEVGASLASPAHNETAESSGKVTAPTINQPAWSLFTGLLFPSLVALRTMFATSCGDPHPLPDKRRFSWKYAPQYVFNSFFRFSTEG